MHSVCSYRVVYALIHALTECGCHRVFLLLLLDELYAIFPAHFPFRCWQPKT